MNFGGVEAVVVEQYLVGSRGSHASTRPRGEMTREADSTPEPRLNGKGRGGRGGRDRRTEGRGMEWKGTGADYRAWQDKGGR